MKPRNKPALIKQLHKSKIEFSISLSSVGSVTVMVFLADGKVRTEIYGSLDPSWSGDGISYHINWGDFEAAVAAAIEEAKREG